ncbi:MAG: GNAT family N-acetyltransferase [Defluviitaleaceae bacterium]|nr:GNAT family N-acetyltransferase [Defluviitaleaceae bacterium]
MKIYKHLENGIKIVEYEDSLAQTLAEMWNRSREDWGGDTGIKTAGQVMAHNAVAAFYNAYVAMDGDEAVGYCSLDRYFGDANTLYISLLGVRPDYQGKKIGKALVQKCTERTIELGYPRIDLHTWGGNTAAVPLYKKCGYLWEDRSDSTHLVNFIPSILNTPLFASFFKKADWYADSTRSWEIVPDGVKVNKFEVFGYTWEKDGEMLAVGFERTGRQMRLIETNDYKIELIAENHELAFGLKYNCTFTVQNKSKKDLHVKITGRQDKNIKFDYSLDTSITGIQEFSGEFYVDAIDEPQDIWRVHPCLLADVEINGEKVLFGLGIESRFPLTVELSDECKVKQISTTTEIYIGIRSALAQDAIVEFSLPDNNLMEFSTNSFSVEIPAEGKTSIKTSAKCLSIGYEPLQVEYKIKFKAGTEILFNRQIHLVNQDLTHAFSCENDLQHSIVNGPWSVNLEKHNNEASFNHITNLGYILNKGVFNPPKLGKPYDDEFNLFAPKVKSYQNGQDMIMEAEYLSEKFRGMAVTRIFTLSAAGVITHKLRVENRSEKSREIMINDSCWIGLGNKTTFRYNGQFTQNHNGLNPDGTSYGFNDVNPDNLEENWIFEASTSNPKGFCWSPDLKPSLKWGGLVIFEIDADEIMPGQTFETQPVVFVCGIFDNFYDFRNYAMKLWKRNEDIPASRVEVQLNKYNPFIHENAVNLEIQSNRETNMEGTIAVSSPGQLFETAEITNENEEEPIKGNSFVLKLTKAPAAVELVNIAMKMAGYEKMYSRALFFAKSGEISRLKEDSSFVVDNGKIIFKADPKYGHVCYSLNCDGYEWLMNQYPEHKPFAWWNIFLGGIRVIPQKLDNNAVLKENITAEFVKVADCYGNMWSGIRTTLIVKEDEELKGSIYETYFVTLPGLPLLCAFYRFTNNTGILRRDVPEFDTFPIVSDVDFYADLKDKTHQKLRLHFGVSTVDTHFESVLKLSSARPQNLYYFHGNKNSSKGNTIWGDNKNPACVCAYMEAFAAPGETFTSSPVFLLITDVDLPEDALEDLERLKFNNAEVLT